METNRIFCSFCGKPDSEIRKIVADPTGKVFICDECIKLCYTVVSGDPKSAE